MEMATPLTLWWKRVTKCAGHSQLFLFTVWMYSISKNVSVQNPVQWIVCFHTILFHSTNAKNAGRHLCYTITNSFITNIMQFSTNELDCLTSCNCEWPFCRPPHLTLSKNILHVSCSPLTEWSASLK